MMNTLSILMKNNRKDKIMRIKVKLLLDYI